MTQVCNQSDQMLFLAWVSIPSLLLGAFLSTFIVLDLLNTDYNLFRLHYAPNFPSKSDSLKPVSASSKLPPDWNDYSSRFVGSEQRLDPSRTEENVPLEILLLGVLDVDVGVF